MRRDEPCPKALVRPTSSAEGLLWDVKACHLQVSVSIAVRTTWMGCGFSRDGTKRVEAFIGRKVIDIGVESIERRGGRQSLFRH